MRCHWRALLSFSFAVALPVFAQSARGPIIDVHLHSRLPEQFTGGAPPVGIHTGLAEPGAPFHGNPNFRAALGNPMLLEPVLIRHPKLRLYLCIPRFTWMSR